MRIILEMIKSPKYVSLVIIKRHLQVRTILRRGMEMTSVLERNRVEVWSPVKHVCA